MKGPSCLRGFMVLLFSGLPLLVSSKPLEKRDTQKYVFAHHMVGNTYPYTVTDWSNDIKLASANGIDAFALNIGSDSWQSTQVSYAYQAAEQSGTSFKLFISFDMTALPCATPADAAALREYITTYSGSSAQFKYDSKVFTSTFSGESCEFGQGSVTEGWSSQFTSQLTGRNEVFFVPSFFVDPATFGTYSSVTNGQFNWNAGWPISVTSSSFEASLQQAGAVEGALVYNTPGSPLMTEIGVVVENLTGSLSSDQDYITNLNNIGNQVYMASVSPWFFTHYSPQTYNKNWIYLSDELYPTRWQAIIESRDSFPLVEVVTWNDYGESHYIGPIEGAQPNSQAWVDGYDHQAWLDLTSYFVQAYKTGTYPTLSQDKIYLWARPHPKDATASNDSVGKPTNYDASEDAVFAVVIATSAGSVTLSTSSISKTVSVPAGLSQLSLPLVAGDTISASLSRNSASVVSLSPSFTFNGSPETYNYNAFVTMASS
ncbi:hypothetical protein M0805_005685 [Coniferiporia weirii]|nr:hypothetical protein M0805_005685 [Coniferiporia weirii]